MPPLPVIVAHVGPVFPVGLVRWTLGSSPRLTVVAKLTFALGDDGGLQLAPPVEGLRASSGAADDPGDFVPRKARADLLLTGRALAPAASTAMRIGATLVDEARPAQQVESLPDGVRVEVFGLWPDAAPRSFELSPVPRFFVDRGRRDGEPVALACDTLWVDLRQQRVTAVWRGEVRILGAGALDIDRLVATVSPHDAPPDEPLLRREVPRAQFSLAEERGRISQPSDAERLKLARLEAMEYAANPSLDVVRYATLSAELAEGRPPRAEVLSRHELSEDDWTVEERAFTQRMGEEAERGDVSLAAEFGEAFVAAQDALARPEEAAFTLQAYAELLAALEVKSDQARVLAERDLTVASYLRIDRRLGAKIEADAGAEAEFQAAFAAARARMTSEAEADPLEGEESDA